MQHCSELEKLRNEINEIDQAVLALAAQRSAIVAQIGHQKRMHGRPVRDTAREAQHIQEMINRFPEIDETLIRNILQAFIQGAVAQQTLAEEFIKSQNESA